MENRYFYFASWHSVVFVTAFRPDDTLLIRTLLVVCGGIVLGLAFLQLGHIIFTSEFRMGHTAIGDVVLFLLIVHVAHNR
ncbi:hypothetical protein [Lactobacillus johnsonii]|uniref:hypothetical protein n=1 Tax=Lactobacillus johnsonii TaxID=33959 RepID=UPI001FB427D7|nr:hypothetical protein [Lactobacillus johnsonii]UOC05424.1 hypothetical protein LC811_06215 [Lactobacillus johnsonii]